MVAYFKCLCRSSERLKAAKLREQGYEIREINKNAQWRSEAASYGLKLPIIVENGHAKSLGL